MDIIFTKNDTQRIKGIAILLMLSYHLFAFPSRVQYDWISLTNFLNFDIEWLFSKSGIICVYIFLFLSGYGICKKFDRLTVKYKDIISFLKKLYIQYWVVFIIFIPIGFLMNKIQFNFIEFILNFTGLSCSYNGEWWFFRLYLFLVLTYPIIKKIMPKAKNSFIFFTCCVALLTYFVNYLLNFTNAGIFIKESLIYSQIRDFLNHQVYFYTGYWFAKFDVFSKFLLAGQNKKINVFFYGYIVVIFSRFIIANNILDFVFIPLFIAWCFILKQKVDIRNRIIRFTNKVLIELGNNSTIMWFCHSFYCYYYFQYWIFLPKISLFIVLLLVIVSYLTSKVITTLYMDIISKI